MHKKYLKYLVLLFAGIFTSCNTSPIATSRVKSAEISDLQYFEPLSVISLVKSKNTAVYSDSLSKISQTFQAAIINSYKEKLHISSVIMWQDSPVNAGLRKEIQNLLADGWKKEETDSVKIGPILDSILEKSNKRFGLITVAKGFTRTKSNYSDEMAKSIALTAATLGMVTRVTKKCESRVLTMIVDAKKNNVAFYRVCDIVDKEPMDTIILRKQFKKIFKGYLSLN